MRVESGGIKFGVEESKALMGSCLLHKDLFEEYKYKEPALSSPSDAPGSDRADQFKVNLSTLIDCLNIFGGGPGSFTSLQIIYKGYGNPLFLMYIPCRPLHCQCRTTHSPTQQPGWRRTRSALTVACAL